MPVTFQASSFELAVCPPLEARAQHEVVPSIHSSEHPAAHAAIRHPELAVYPLICLVGLPDPIELEPRLASLDVLFGLNGIHSERL